MDNSDFPSDPVTAHTEPPLIILVEDNVRFASVMQASLEAEGFQVRHTRSGAETIKAARATSPALLVLDYTLPDMSAHDIIDGLAGEGFNFPFIIVTSQDSTTIAVEMIKLGARDYLLKNSAAVDNLPEVVRQTLEKIDRDNNIEMARQALGHEEEMLSAAFEYSPVGTLIASPDGRIKRINEAVCQMLKLSESDLLGANMLSFIHPEDRGQCRQALDDMNLGKRDDFQVEKRLINKEGKILWVQNTCWMVRGENGVAKYAVAHLQNISKRKQAEDELQSNREISRAVLEAMPLGVFTLTADGKPHFANQQAIDLLGKGIIDTDVDSLAKTYDAYLKDTNEPYPINRMPVVRALSGEQCSVSDMEIDRTDGRIRLEVWGSPVFDDHGNIKYAVATFADISRRSQMESELRRDQKLKALGTLAGGISHDFNNILFTMLGFTALAKKHTVEKAEAYKYLLRIEDAGARAMELVKQVLNFGRPPGLEKKPIRIQLVIEETLDMLRGTIPPGVGIIKNLGRECSPVLADFTQVHQVLMNITANAIQAMKRLGGILQVDLDEIEIEESGLFKDEKLEPGRYVRVIIRDTGHGMNNAAMERIFEPYFTTKNTGEGTGLGLSTAYGIVSSLGGGIRVNSKLNEGTQFSVFLPAQSEDRSTELPADQLVAEKEYRAQA
jgi:two-component system cell cycle sensor histidine kinase/response regulator CckA